MTPSPTPDSSSSFSARKALRLSTSALAQALAVTLTMGLALGLASTATAEEGGSLLNERLASFEPFLGTWEVETQWSSGTKVWSKAIYTPAVDGQFVDIKTWVRDGDGPVYLRYHSMLGIDAEGAAFAQSFNHDGSTRSVQYETPAPGTLVTEWTMGQATIRDRYESTGEHTARWRVWMRPAADEAAEWTQILDGTWHRVADAEATNQRAGDQMTQTSKSASNIDAEQFVASGPGVRSIEIHRTIAAPVSKVYAAFSDGVAFKQAYGPNQEELEAHIDLAIGGRYEWLFDGEIGSNGCQVLSYQPNRMISFTWNAPPSQANNREKRTWVVVDFQKTGDSETAVTLTHLGFGEGEEWDETQGYFEKAWDFVLTTMKTNLEG